MIKKTDLIQFYTDKKMSAFQIAQIFKCSVHKVDYWLKRYDIQKRNISDAIYVKHNPHGDPFAIKMPKTLQEAVLYGLGLGLYWGEGNKRNLNSIRLGNTDPKLMKRFISFLKVFCGIKKTKLKFGLQIFSDMNPNLALKFWRDCLDLKNSQFQKIIVTPARSIGTYRQKTKHGVLTVYFHNKKLRNILIGEIEKF